MVGGGGWGGCGDNVDEGLSVVGERGRGVAGPATDDAAISTLKRYSVVAQIAEGFYHRKSFTPRTGTMCQRVSP